MRLVHSVSTSVNVPLLHMCHDVCTMNSSILLPLHSIANCLVWVSPPWSPACPSDGPHRHCRFSLVVRLIITAFLSSLFILNLSFSSSFTLLCFSLSSLPSFLQLHFALQHVTKRPFSLLPSILLQSSSNSGVL